MTHKQRIRKWIKALKSGEFKQCIGLTQCGQDTFCVMGVAFVVRGRLTKKKRYPAGASSKHLEKLFGHSSKQTGDLLRLNDSGKTFGYLAKYIEDKILTTVS